MLLLDFTELLLDFAELLDATLEEDLTELLDFAELLLDRSSTGAEDDERTELLDFGATLEEEDFALDEEFDFTELLLASSQSSQTLDEESSPGRTKLLSSSSQAASAKAMANAATAPTNLLNGAFLMIDILFVPSIPKLLKFKPFWRRVWLREPSMRRSERQYRWHRTWPRRP